ncbi:MAG: hypothetical protein ACRDI1_07330, partial [Actinomycetota bacterium]
VSPDGTTVFITGSSRGTESGCDFSGDGQRPNDPGVLTLPCSDFATIAYVASSGAQLWVMRFNGPRALNDEARALGVSPDGSKVFVTGASETFQMTDDYATVAYAAATGVQLWTKRYGSLGLGDDRPFSLDVAPDGSKVFVTGRSQATDESDFDFATVAYGAAGGATLWAKRFDGPGDSADDAGESVAASPDGSTVFVTGGSRESSRLAQFITIAYDSTSGATRWLNSYSRGNSGGQVVGVSPDGGTVFVAGICYWSSSNFDVCTLGIGAGSGDRLWESRYNGTPQSDDYVQDLRVSPDGSKVFVGGSTWKMANGDYATAAISTS